MRRSLSLVLHTHILLLFLFLLCPKTNSAQFITASPYSSYGAGESYFSGLAYNTGIGFGGVALDSNVNVLNPAGLSGISLTKFHGSVVSRAVQYSQADANQFKWNTSLDHLVFGFPIKKRSAISFGLMPHTGIGVNQSDTVDTPLVGQINYLNNDSGGLNKAFLAGGLGIKNFSIGAEGGFIFGNLNRQRDLLFLNDPSALNVSKEVSTKVTGATFKAGLHYKFSFPIDSAAKASGKVADKFAIGLTYSPGTMLAGNTGFITRTFSLNAAGERTSTVIIENETNIHGTLYLPQEGSFGLAYFKGEKWNFNADLFYRQWSAYQSFESKDTLIENGEALFSGSDSLTDSWRLSAGVQFSPKQRNKYSFGGYYQSGGVRINGIDMKEKGITFGISIKAPSKIKERVPVLDIGIALGERGTIENNLTKERFVTARIGMTISDRWFVRRKFD